MIDEKSRDKISDVEKGDMNIFDPDISSCYTKFMSVTQSIKKTPDSDEEN